MSGAGIQSIMGPRSRGRNALCAALLVVIALAMPGYGSAAQAAPPSSAGARSSLISGVTLTREQREALCLEAQTAAVRGAQRPAEEREAAVADFLDAARRYEQLIADGVRNGAIYYNLGGAYLQAGDVGRAILAYRRGQSLSPRDPRLRANLSYARSLRVDQIRPTGRRALLERAVDFHRSYPATWRANALLATWIALWIAMAALLLRPGLVLRVVAAGLLLAAAAIGGTIAYDELWPPAEEGVILADEVVVRKGNGQGFEPMYAEPLHEGTEFVVRERRPDWLEIELADGARGWVPQDAVGSI